MSGCKKALFNIPTQFFTREWPTRELGYMLEPTEKARQDVKPGYVLLTVFYGLIIEESALVLQEIYQEVFDQVVQKLV